MNRILSFFRHPSESSRPAAARATAEPRVAIAFDRWLDSRSPEWSTSGMADEPAQSLSDADRTAFASMTETFDRIDHLDTRTAGRVDERLQATIWEDIMQATHSLPATGSSMPTVPGLSRAPVRPSIPPAGEDRRTRTGGFARFSPVLNVAMAALLVLVLGLSAWAVAGHRWGGSGDDPGRTGVPGGLASLAALNPNATPASPVTEGILPTADECTIQPLTIDQVMARVKGPFPGSIDNVPVVEASPIAYGTPPLLKGVVPQQADIDAIAAVQREFVACSIKGNLLQVWAFYAPESEFWRSFLDRYPRFVDEATVRSDLEAYLAGDTNLFLPGLGWDGVQTVQGTWIPDSLPLVNPDPAASFVIGDQMTNQGRFVEINVSMLYYDPANPDAAPRYIPREDMARIWDYRWDEASQAWVIVSVGLDANRG